MVPTSAKMAPLGVPGRVKNRVLPFCYLFASIWLPKRLHFETLLAPCATFLGYHFLLLFGYPKSQPYGANRVPQWSHFGGQFCYLFQKGQISIFDNPYIENTAFSLPGRSQNEVNIDAKTGTLKRASQNTQKVPKVTPKGNPLGTVFPTKKGTKKTPRKKTLNPKPKSASPRWSSTRHGFSPPRTPPLFYNIINYF